jgi:hypothetical protein
MWIILWHTGFFRQITTAAFISLHSLPAVMQALQDPDDYILSSPAGWHYGQPSRL